MGLEPSLAEQLLAGGILRQGHFAFRSGRHSSGLIDRDLLLADPSVTSHFGYALAKEFFNQHVETIATPSIWGAGLAQWVGYFLEPKAKVVGATPKDGRLTVAPKLAPLIGGKRVLLVDNLIISGETMAKFLEILRAENAEIIGIASLWSAADLTFDCPSVATLLNRQYPSWTADECPLCRDGRAPVEQIPY